MKIEFKTLDSFKKSFLNNNISAGKNEAKLKNSRMAQKNKIHKQNKIFFKNFFFNKKYMDIYCNNLKF